MMLAIDSNTLSLIGADLIPDIGRYVVPICVEYRRKPRVVGTGFLIAMEGRHFLVSAAHVLDKLDDGQRYFYPVDRRVTRLISGTVIRSAAPAGRSRIDDKIDVGVVVLRGDGMPPYSSFSIEALESDRVARWMPNRLPAKFAVAGYPASQGKGNPVTKQFAPTMQMYLSGTVSTERYKELGLDPRTHVVLPFDAKEHYDPTGNRVAFPHPSGMSGGPVWQLFGPHADNRHLIGVLIEYRAREKVLIAADIGFAFDFINDHLPM